MSRINASKTNISRDCRTVQVLVVVWGTISLQDICNIKPWTRRVAVVIVTVGHAGQRPGTLSVVGYSAGQGTQNAEPRIAGSLHGIRPIARRERPMITMTGATVIAVGRAGLRSHFACNERSREHRFRTTRTNTDEESSVFGLSHASYYCDRTTTERRRSVKRTTTSGTSDIDPKTNCGRVYCCWRTTRCKADDQNSLRIAHREQNLRVPMVRERKQRRLIIMIW